MELFDSSRLLHFGFHSSTFLYFLSLVTLSFVFIIFLSYILFYFIEVYVTCYFSLFALPSSPFSSPSLSPSLSLYNLMVIILVEIRLSKNYVELVVLLTWLKNILYLMVSNESLLSIGVVGI